MKLKTIQTTHGITHQNKIGELIFNYKINSQCNNNCIMCIIKQPERKKEIEFEDFLKTVQKINNYDQIVITGGEPTLKKDFLKIMTFLASQFNGKILLLTNARRFSNKTFLEQFQKINFKKKISIGIPFYASKKEIFEAISRTPDSFEQTIKAIHNLQKKNYEIELRIIIHKLNYQFLKDIVKFIFLQYKNKVKILFANMEYVGNAEININSLFVSYSEIKPYLEDALDSVKEYRINTIVNQMPLCFLNKKYWCFADKNTIVSGEHKFLKQCKLCLVKEKCSGIWETYFKKGDEKEFTEIIELA